MNDWVNNHEAGDLRRHGGHYDVSVMNASKHINKPSAMHNSRIYDGTEVSFIMKFPITTSYGSGHGTAAVLLPGFAINW